jgi:hypothetical protein
VQSLSFLHSYDAPRLKNLQMAEYGIGLAFLRLEEEW